MNEKVYSVINNYDRARRLVEIATFTDYSSATQFARACSSGVNFHYGDLLFKIMPNGKEFEAEGDK